MEIQIGNKTNYWRTVPRRNETSKHDKHRQRKIEPIPNHQENRPRKTTQRERNGATHQQDTQQEQRQEQKEQTNAHAKAPATHNEQ